MNSLARHGFHLKVAVECSIYQSYIFAICLASLAKAVRIDRPELALIMFQRARSAKGRISSKPLPDSIRLAKSSAKRLLSSITLFQ
jgi:hypothetical protein